jgi:hypothetical protein
MWGFYLFYLFHLLNIKQGPLSLVSTIEELLERKSSGSGLETEISAVGGSTALTTQHPSIGRSWH